MNCEACGIQTVERKATINAPYKYTLSGLKNIFLVGINVMECPNCHEKFPIIPKMEELHNLIAENLINKEGLLKGDEIRFLRKNAGFSSMRFAALVKITPSALSRVEAGKEELRPTVHKLIRAVAALSLEDSKIRDLLLETADKIMNPKPTFKLDGKTWKPLKAA